MEDPYVYFLLRLNQMYQCLSQGLVPRQVIFTCISLSFGTFSDPLVKSFFFTVSVAGTRPLLGPYKLLLPLPLPGLVTLPECLGIVLK